MACASLSTRWATGLAVPAVSSTSSRCSSSNERRSVVIVAGEEPRPNRGGKKMAKSPKGKQSFEGENIFGQLREWTEKSTTMNEMDPLLMKIKKEESEKEKKPPADKEKEKKPEEGKKGLFGF